MKKLVLFGLALLLTTTAFSQVGIGTTTPAAPALLDLTSTNKGLLIPRVANTAAVTSPVNGMIIYDIAAKCVKGYENGAWSSCFGITVANVPTVTSTTGKIWMDRNLGATRVATTVTDFQAYGDLYQWGRRADGHQRINWTSATAGTPANGTTTTNADIPANASFITEGTFPFDWRVNRDDNLWNGVAAVNNPCPAGYRLPTSAEITAEVTAYNITDSATAFSSPLKFTVPGFRSGSSGNIALVGSSGGYWSSSVSGDTGASRNFLSNSTSINNNNRTTGQSVRCLKD